MKHRKLPRKYLLEAGTATTVVNRRSRLVDLGLQYYVVGRWSFLHHFRISGTLFHHSVECLLKAGMPPYYTNEDLRKTFKHKLQKLWSEFKCFHPQATLARFDVTVKALDRLWELRYPPTFPYELLHTFRTNDTATLMALRSGKSIGYKLTVEHVDDLIREIIRGLRINLAAFDRVVQKADAMRAIMTLNRSPLEFGRRVSLSHRLATYQLMKKLGMGKHAVPSGKGTASTA